MRKLVYSPIALSKRKKIKREVKLPVSTVWHCNDITGNVRLLERIKKLFFMPKSRRKDNPAAFSNKAFIILSALSPCPV